MVNHLNCQLTIPNSLWSKLSGLGPAVLWKIQNNVLLFAASYSRDSTLQLSGVNSPRSGISSFMNLSFASKNRASNESSLLEEERQTKLTKMPSCLDY